MSFSYTYTSLSEIGLKRTGSDGDVVIITVDPKNTLYAEFLASGETAAPYVAPPAPPEPTPEEKLARSGLTVDELKGLLGI